MTLSAHPMQRTNQTLLMRSPQKRAPDHCTICGVLAVRPGAGRRHRSRSLLQGQAFASKTGPVPRTLFLCEREICLIKVSGAQCRALPLSTSFPLQACPSGPISNVTVGPANQTAPSPPPVVGTCDYPCLNEPMCLEVQAIIARLTEAPQ